MTIQLTMTFETVTKALDALTKLGSASSPAATVASVPIDAKPEPSVSLPLPKAQLSSPAVSDAVRKYAADNNVDLAELKGSGKDGRIIKSDVTAIINARVALPTPEPEEEDPFALEPAAPPAQTAPKEDDRDALVGYQTALRDKLIDDGEEEEDAKREAMTKARALLERLSGGKSTLGGLEEADYAKVVGAANSAKAKL